MAACDSLPENTVNYKLFPLINIENANSFSKKDALERIAERYISMLSGWINRYIWQNDSFNLRVVDETAGSPAHLEGISCFGDNIEDEWFIVFLCHHLTEKDQNLVIQLQDNDGEFLLIESADYVPEWLDPDTSENRIFLYQGALHVIPMAQNPSEITPIPGGKPCVDDAVAAVRNFSTVTKASGPVQAAIKQRIQGYPQKMAEFKHRAHCYVPAAVAVILKEDPKLLPYAVKAFYQRDPLDLKACRAMRFFAPETRVMTEVAFSRCLYAQLASQKYEPDKRTGWNLPPINSPNRKAHEIGMKLACGFEILASNADKLMNMDDNISDVDFNNDVRWRRFSKSLKDKGYFRGEIEGSKLHTSLLLQAKNFYLSSLKNDSNSYASLNPGVRVRKLLETLSINFDEMKETEKSLQPPDDDSWMEITPETLDSMLEQMSKKRVNEATAAEEITTGLKSFIQHVSDFEGAELPSNKQKPKKQKVNLDGCTDAFIDDLKEILDLRVPHSEDEYSSSSMSGYSDDDDDGEEISLGETKCNMPKNIRKKKKVLDDMKAYMNQMDRELAKTDVGLSFERLPPQSRQEEVEEVPRVPLCNEDDFDDDYCPVDVNLTTLKNILESYSSQDGMPGPASNLFSSMGVQLPDNAD